MTTKPSKYNGEQLKELLGDRLESISLEIKDISERTGIDLTIGSYNGTLSMDTGNRRSHRSGDMPSSHSFMFQYSHGSIYNLDLKRCSSSCRWCHCPFCIYEHGEKCPSDTNFSWWPFNKHE